MGLVQCVRRIGLNPFASCNNVVKGVFILAKKQTKVSKLTTSNLTWEEALRNFLFIKKAEGLSKTTLMITNSQELIGEFRAARRTPAWTNG